MLRVKLLKDTKYGSKGSIQVIDNNEAFGLIDNGSAVISKDMTPDDYKQAGDTNGKPTRIRINHSK